MPHKNNSEKQTPSNGQAAPLRIEFEDNALLLELCGQHDQNLSQIEERLGVQLVPRGNRIAIMGHPDQAERARAVLEDLYDMLEKGTSVAAPQVDAALRITGGLLGGSMRASEIMNNEAVINTPKVRLNARSVQQHVYISALKRSDLTFGIGPAGTGKTFLAVAWAVSLLSQKQIKKIILTRPVVEAGESLGFLPGTLEEKVDPYLRPLFDGLEDTLGADKAKDLREKGVIEIAPLAYMRGRTLKDCVMILDEAQNTTPVQMKMFLTRLGENSRMIVTGDLSQIDLPKGKVSGLRDSIHVLEGMKNIDVVRFTDADVVRHDLVSRIVQAYDQRDRQITMNIEGE